MFLKVYFSIPSFREKSLFSTWLYRITVNECIDAIKKNRHKPVSLESNIFADNPATLKDVLKSDEVDAEKQILRQETQEFIRSQIVSLPDKYRLIITLKDLENLSYKEISRIMDISMEKVKVWLFRARQKLKEKIGSFSPNLSDSYFFVEKIKEYRRKY